MRFAGIDIASETQVVAVVDENAGVRLKPLAFAEDATGYAKLLAALGPPAGMLVAMEATGHYWKNLFATLAAQKRPTPTRLPDSTTEELRELVRLRDRLTQDFGGISTKRLARLCYDGRHQVGAELAAALIDAAHRSVGRHHGEPYRIQVRYACEDLDTSRRRLRSLDRDIEGKLAEHEVGTLLTSIEGLGPHTAARLIATLGNPSHFRSAAALASYVGVIPGFKQSGKNRSPRASLAPLGNARLRAKLWMPTLTAVRLNPWLRTYYQGLRARGKLPKVALVACMRKLLLAVYTVAKHRKPFVSHCTNSAQP